MSTTHWKDLIKRKKPLKKRSNSLSGDFTSLILPESSPTHDAFLNESNDIKEGKKFYH